MIKDILLNYIMGKYRRIIVIICACIGLLIIGRLIILDNFIFGEKFFALVLSYLAFIVAIYNGSPVGFPAVNTVIYAELSGDFPLGDSRQPIYKSLRP
ncbi:hypothetical protein ABTJ44_19265, partial [Acinetobacter baumannii]